LLKRVQTAQKYNEGLPNVLFYGDPGTGKTAFVRLLAKESGLDYALTSGSEFAKITDLNEATNELRNLLRWAYESKKGLIVFIDEAESLFAHRNLHASSKVTQDFVNTFLSLIPDQSQKKVMFIFATNHPFKLDDAITNRIGMSVEFTLPSQAEREKILTLYMDKAAQENKQAVVTISSEVRQVLASSAKNLTGFSPRTLKFLAEEIVARARRTASLTVTVENVQAVIDEAQRTKEQFVRWEKERDAWTASYSSALGHRAESC
jgi:ATPase family AAA domain-containing protein 3A/B